MQAKGRAIFAWSLLEGSSILFTPDGPACTRVGLEIEKCGGLRTRLREKRDLSYQGVCQSDATRTPVMVFFEQSVRTPAGIRMIGVNALPESEAQRMI
jgi:hypothetical protein